MRRSVTASHVARAVRESDVCSRRLLQTAVAARHLAESRAAAEGHGARRRRRLDRSGVLGRSPALAKTPASSESKEKDADPTRHTVTHVTLEKKIGDLWGVTDNGADELDVRLLPMPEPDLGADRDRLANGLASAEFVECP